MKSNEEEKSIKWLIGASGSDWDAVNIYTFEGTKFQAKEQLLKLVKDAKENYDGYDEGTETLDEIKEYYNPQDNSLESLYAWANFENSHDDYMAIPEDVIGPCPDGFYSES